MFIANIRYRHLMYCHYGFTGLATVLYQIKMITNKLNMQIAWIRLL